MMDFKNKTSGAVNEIKYIAAAIVHSREQKKEMEEELTRRYGMMSKAQAIALQAQINPHMLYNTLEAINWKVMRLTFGKNEASVMIHTLSRLLRLSLSTGENIIPLRAEMEHARLYVEVEQLHYKDQLKVFWKINEKILDYLTVKLTLQPIIENAIYHGIKPSGRPGVISIIGYEDMQSVILKIKDNGVGISQVLADKINQGFQSDEIKEDAHIGLSNVNQRIRLIFGKPYGIKIYGKEGEGTIVEMRIPKQT
jgi:two-component system sensor histidine kinase YesM